MTVTQTPAVELDEASVGAFAEGIFGAALGTLDLTIAYIGRKVGLYEALRGHPSTSSELAAAAGADERYVREWLEHQAVSGTVTVDDTSAPAEARRFALPEEHAVVLLDQEHPAYSGALADVLGPVTLTLDLVIDAFRTGEGVPYAAYDLHDMQAGFTRPMFANSLVSEWIPALADVHDRLEAGEPLRIADFGCGVGWAAIYLAEAYPNAIVHGYDLDDSSIAEARKQAADRGVADRVRFEVQDVTDPSFGERYDLVFATEVIHDLADPVGALSAMRRLAGDGGAVLIVDEHAAEAFDVPGDEIERLLYGFSILHCLPAGRTHEHSAATGTVMRPSTLEAYASRAGFGSTEVLTIDNPMFRFYRLR